MKNKSAVLQMFYGKMYEYELCSAVLSDSETPYTEDHLNDRLKRNFDTLSVELRLLSDILDDDLPKEYYEKIEEI